MRTWTTLTTQRREKGRQMRMRRRERVVRRWAHTIVPSRHSKARKDAIGRNEQ